MEFHGNPAKFACTNEKCRIFFAMKQSGDRWIWDDLQYSFDGKKSWSNDII